MASGKYQHSAYFPRTIEPSSHLRNKWLLHGDRGCLFAGERVFSLPLSLPNRGFIASEGDKCGQWLVEAATVPKIPPSGSRRLGECRLRQRQMIVQYLSY